MNEKLLTVDHFRCCLGRGADIVVIGKCQVKQRARMAKRSRILLSLVLIFVNERPYYSLCFEIWAVKRPIERLCCCNHSLRALLSICLLQLLRFECAVH